MNQNPRPLPVAVLLSGTGRTLGNLLQQIDVGRVHARVVAVASNRDRVRGLEIAAAAGIPTAVFRKSAYPDSVSRDRAMWGFVQEYGAELVVLAGYLALLDLEPSRGVPVINIHPALLPRHGGAGYYGDRVHESVLASGDTETGCTVHRVDPIFDHGPILAQQVVPVHADDTVRSLANRVFEAECQLYPQTIDRIARGELVLGGA